MGVYVLVCDLHVSVFYVCISCMLCVHVFCVTCECSGWHFCTFMCVLSSVYKLIML